MTGPITDVVLLRGLLGLPDQPLRVGSVLAARVLEREGARGTLLLNGVRVPAQLPPDLLEGDALRVRVTEASADRVVLQVVPQTPSQTAPPPAAFALVLPGGAHARVFVDEEEGGGTRSAEGARTVTLRYDSPALGRLDFVLDLEASAISGIVHATAGAPADRARSAANELQAALASATGRSATVQVREREETLDVRA